MYLDACRRYCRCVVLFREQQHAVCRQLLLSLELYKHRALPSPGPRGGQAVRMLRRVHAYAVTALDKITKRVAQKLGIWLPAD